MRKKERFFFVVVVFFWWGFLFVGLERSGQERVLAKMLKGVLSR